MNRLEHLLFVLAEECAEVAQRASKAARFGLDETQTGQPLSNEDRIWEEMNDLVAMTELLAELRGKGGLSRDAIEAKKLKFETYLAYSETCGTLQENPTWGRQQVGYAAGDACPDVGYAAGDACPDVGYAAGDACPDCSKPMLYDGGERESRDDPGIAPFIFCEDCAIEHPVDLARAS